MQYLIAVFLSKSCAGHSWTLKTHISVIKAGSDAKVQQVGRSFNVLSSNTTNSKINFCAKWALFSNLLTYVEQSAISERRTVWLCLYTCCVMRAIHLDLVPNLNAFTFLRSFKCFTARWGIPSKVVSDNGKTFKSACKITDGVFNKPEVKHFIELHIEWAFNLEKAPRWRGIRTYDQVCKTLLEEISWAS